MMSDGPEKRLVIGLIEVLAPFTAEDCTDGRSDPCAGTGQLALRSVHLRHR